MKNEFSQAELSLAPKRRVAGYLSLLTGLIVPFFLTVTHTIMQGNVAPITKWGLTEIPHQILNAFRIRFLHSKK